MLSDTLFDSVQEINEYRRRYPDIYDQYQQRLNDLVAEMTAIQKLLDFPGDLSVVKT